MCKVHKFVHIDHLICHFLVLYPNVSAFLKIIFLVKGRRDRDTQFFHFDDTYFFFTDVGSLSVESGEHGWVSAEVKEILETDDLNFTEGNLNMSTPDPKVER